MIKCFLFLNMLLFSLLSLSQQTFLSKKIILLDSGAVFSNPPFQSCHASTLVELPGNKIMVAWFGGKSEGSPDVSIWTSTQENGKWSQPIEAANGLQENNERFACWNPVLFATRTGLLFLFYKVGSSPRTWWGEMKISSDQGKSWSAAKKIPDGFLGPIKDKPIQLSNGDILCPSSTESESGNSWKVHLERCDSSGNNWEKILIYCDTFNAIQPTILTYKTGNMQMLCRTQNNVIAQSWSYDGGETWTKLTATSLSNPNSGIDAVSTGNNLQLLVYNPLPHGTEWWEGRSVLRLAVSSDGKEWQDIYTLENHKKGEFSYPAIISGSAGQIFITYTYLRKWIKFVRLRM